MIVRPALALALLAGCAEKLPEAHVMPLVAAEKSFDREVSELGIRKAFAAAVAADAILLQPAPVAADAGIAALPETLKLTWEPSFAEIAASGDLGWTTGPYHAHRDGDTTTVRHGHYVSVWRRDGDRWRLVIDGGSPHPPPLDLPDRFTYAAARVSADSADPAAELKSLRAVEDDLIAALATPGRSAQALVAVAAPDLRYHPPNSFPVVGPGAVQTALLARADTLTFTPQGAGVSRAGDLGYVHGAVTRKAGPQAPVEEGGYLRIWRRAKDGRWQLALDLTITAPPPAPAP